MLLAGAVLAPVGWWLAPERSAPDAWTFACGLLLYPWLEEWLFRGALQPWLARQRLLRRRRWAGITAANAIASLLFAAAHGPGRPLLWAVATLLPSLLLGAVRERTGGIAPCVALHAWFNAGGLALAAWRASG